METIKTSILLISPVGGIIQEVNGALDENPQLINTDPYGEGWLFKVAPTDWEGDKKFLLERASLFPQDGSEDQGGNGQEIKLEELI